MSNNLKVGIVGGGIQGITSHSQVIENDEFTIKTKET